jgi:hypothetical protein
MTEIMTLRLLGEVEGAAFEIAAAAIFLHRGESALPAFVPPENVEAWLSVLVTGSLKKIPMLVRENLADREGPQGPDAVFDLDVGGLEHVALRCRCV